MWMPNQFAEEESRVKPWFSFGQRRCPFSHPRSSSLSLNPARKGFISESCESFWKKFDTICLQKSGQFSPHLTRFTGYGRIDLGRPGVRLIGCLKSVLESVVYGTKYLYWQGKLWKSMLKYSPGMFILFMGEYFDHLLTVFEKRVQEMDIVSECIFLHKISRKISQSPSTCPLKISFVSISSPFNNFPSKPAIQDVNVFPSGAENSLEKEAKIRQAKKDEDCRLPECPLARAIIQASSLMQSWAIPPPARPAKAQ